MFSTRIIKPWDFWIKTLFFKRKTHGYFLSLNQFSFKFLLFEIVVFAERSSKTSLAFHKTFIISTKTMKFFALNPLFKIKTHGNFFFKSILLLNSFCSRFCFSQKEKYFQSKLCFLKILPLQ